jgi:rare lipoprotein A
MSTRTLQALSLAALCCLAVAADLAAAPASTDSTVTSYYSSRYNGRRTASGERFNNNALTAAHPLHAFGTRLRLTNTNNGKSVVVRVNDRGPFVKGRDLSVTRQAARQLVRLRPVGGRSFAR